MKFADVFDEKIKSEVKDWLKQINFLCNLDDSSLNQLVDALEIKKVSAGSVAIFQGTITNNFYLIQKGKFEVAVKTKDGVKKIAELGPGEYFGEISLLEPVTATGTVKAIQPGILYILSGEDFNQILGNKETVIQKLKEKIAIRKIQQSSGQF